MRAHLFRFPQVFLLFLVCFTLVFASEFSLDEEHPGHSSQGPAFNEGPRQKALLYGGMGDVSFAITTSSEMAQKYFLQGVGQLHGFFSFEAERSFRTAAALDNNCAMCFWGMAMANTVDLAGSQARAKEFIEKAKSKMEGATLKEKAWIETLWKLYQGKIPVELEQRKTYLKELESISNQYPEDLEAKAFIALTLWENYTFYKAEFEKERMDKLVDEVLSKNPNHPAHHYKIHLWDSAKEHAKALNSAAQCGPASPKIGHMWHMPGHIYWGLERYSDSAWQQEASARVDHADMRLAGNMPYQIGNYYHNNSWLMSSLARTGEANKAITIGKNLFEIPRHPSENPFTEYGADSLRNILTILDEYEMWETALSLMDSPYLNVENHFPETLYKERIRTLASYYLKRPATEVMANLQKTQKLIPLETDNKVFQAIEMEMKVYESLLKDPGPTVLPLLKEFENKARAALPQQWNRYWEQLPDFHLESLFASAQAYEEAIKYIQDLAAAKKESVGPLAKEVLTLNRVGATEKAKAAFKKLLLLSESIDLSTPLIKRLTEVAIQWGYPKDWRIPRVKPNDLGPRPPLDSLGPLLWERSKVSLGTLPEFDKFLENGKPLMVVFYIGGCPACSAQIKALTEEGWDEKFKEAGINLIGIGTKKNPNEEGNFPLLADEEKKLFKKLGVYDDFEDKPLHGIFLIDSKGKIAWKTVTADTFNNFSFLLNEGKRLLLF